MNKLKKRVAAVLMAAAVMFTTVSVVGEPLIVNAQYTTSNVASVASSLREYNIPLQNGGTLPVSQIREDYIAFIFGRTTCFNCNMMTSDMDALQKAGISIHKVFIPIDTTPISDFAVRHPGTMTIAGYTYANSNMANRLCNQAGLGYGALPTFFILDKNRNLVWASVGPDDSELFGIFGIKGADYVDVDYGTQSTSINVGYSYTVSAIPNPSDARVISTNVSSSNNNVIEVASDGRTITAKAPGSAVLSFEVEYFGTFSFEGAQEISAVKQKISKPFYVSQKKETSETTTTPSQNNTSNSSDCCDTPGNNNTGSNSSSTSAPTQTTTTTVKNKTKKPAATKVTSLTKGKKSFTVKWKKVSGVKGYELQYSTSSKFNKPVTKTYDKASTTKATIKKLKSKKTYYVRMRTFKKVNGKKIYSSWSAKKKVKVK